MSLKVQLYKLKADKVYRIAAGSSSFKIFAE